jgi:hypothetical protein
MGKLALPFMNKTMSLFLTNWSMRCCASLIIHSTKKIQGNYPKDRGLFHFWPLAPAAPVYARDVLAALHLHKALRSQQMLHGWCLVKAVFQEQPSAWQQVGWGLGGDVADVVQAVRAADQRLQRLRPQSR